MADNVSHPRRLDPTMELITYFFVLYLQHGRHDVKCKPSIHKNIHSQTRHRLVANCQFCRLVATYQRVATTTSISSSCNKSVKIRFVGIFYLQTSYNLLNQLATSLLTTSLDDQFAASKSCRKPCERILTLACCKKLLQDVNRLVATRPFHKISLNEVLHKNRGWW